MPLFSENDNAATVEFFGSGGKECCFGVGGFHMRMFSNLSRLSRCFFVTVMKCFYALGVIGKLSDQPIMVV